MDTGFFTFRNHTFQFAVFAQSQSNGDLIQFIFRKNYFPASFSSQGSVSPR